MPRRSSIHACVLASLAALPCAEAGQNSASINLAGLQIRNGVNQTRSSAPDVVGAAYIYDTVVTGTAHGVGGALQSLFPNPTPIEEIIETLTGAPVSGLSGSAANPSGALPFVIPPFTQSGQQVIGIITVTYALTLTTSIDAAGVCSFSITDVTLTPSFLVGYLEFDTGAATVTRVCPGDTNRDNLVNFTDLNQILSEFGLVGDPLTFAGDVNADGSVSFADLNIVLSGFGGGC